MMSSFIDLEIPADDYEEEMMQAARPFYVAVVDLSSSEEFLELTKSALLAALEALADHCLGLLHSAIKWDYMMCKVLYLLLRTYLSHPDADGTIPIELEDVMPLLSFLAPVETCKDRISAALETLKPTTSWERSGGSGAGQGMMDGVYLGGRGFGVAMEALSSQ